jgi:hypothetical protein
VDGYRIEREAKEEFLWGNPIRKNCRIESYMKDNCYGCSKDNKCPKKSEYHLSGEIRA